MFKKLAVYRWFIWGALLPAYLIVMFHRSSFGTIRDDLSGTFGFSAIAFANLSSMYFYAYMFMQIPTGMLVDTLGVRYTVTAGMLLAGAGSFLFGYSPSIYIVFLGRFFIGIGASVIFVSILKTLSCWFDEKEFGTMTGLTGFIGNIGGILTQTPFVLIVSMLTWRYSFVMVGVVTVMVALLCFAVIRNKPEDMGFPTIQKYREVGMETEKAGVIKAMMKILKNPYTWPPFILCIGFFGAYQSLTGTWGQSYIMKVYGMNKITAANYILLVFIGAALGSTTIGRLSDKLLKRKIPMLVFGLINIISWLLLIFLNKGKPPIEILAILLFMFGFSYSTISLSWACGKEVNNPRYAGISTSVINIGGFLGAAVVPVILGMVINKYKDVLSDQQLYARTFSYALLSVVIGFICILFIKETGCKNIWGKKNEGNIVTKVSYK